MSVSLGMMMRMVLGLRDARIEPAPDDWIFFLELNRLLLLLF